MLILNFSFLFFNLVQNGNAAASLSVAEQYVSAFSNLAKQSNTVLLPTNTGDISGMVSQVCICAQFCVWRLVCTAPRHDINTSEFVPSPLRLWVFMVRWQRQAQNYHQNRRRRRKRSLWMSQHFLKNRGLSERTRTRWTRWSIFQFSVMSRHRCVINRQKPSPDRTQRKYHQHYKVLLWNPSEMKITSFFFWQFDWSCLIVVWVTNTSLQPNVLPLVTGMSAKTWMQPLLPITSILVCIAT